MASKFRMARGWTALSACMATCLAAQTRAQCIGYTVAPGPGTFASGTSDIGLYQDDGLQVLSLPFNVNFYGSTYSNVNVCSNGHIQFGTAPSNAYANTCLPTATFTGPALMPFWDDLWTVGGTSVGQGVFTDVSGAPGSQVFVIEWRAVYYLDGIVAPRLDFEVKFYENQSFFDVIFDAPMTDRCSATIGCQDTGGAAAPFTQFSCNTSGVTPCSGSASTGLSLRFTCDAGTPGACCTNDGACSVVANSSVCGGTSVFAGNSSTCSGAGGSCPIALGACCSNTTGACAYVAGSSACTTSSTYSGDGTVCSPNTCPEPGSCCDTTANICSVIAQSGCSGIFSGPGTTCTTNPCPPPANDECNGTVPALALETPFTGSNVNALTSYAPGDPYACGPALPTSGGLRDVFHTFVPPASGQYSADLCGSSFDTVMSVHTGCPATDFNRIGCNDDSAANTTCPTNGLNSRIPLLNLTQGLTYYFRVAGYNGASGTYILTVHAGGLDIGSCCTAGTGACTETTQGNCAAGNAWTQGGICTVDICPLDNGGACCTNVGGCSQTVQTSCFAPSIWSAGATCATPIPCAAVGACCSATNGCTQVTQATCAAGSVWAPGGCTPVPCPLGGACCNNTSGACSTTQQGNCGSGSTFQGNGIACNPNPCPQPPSGVCCRGSTCNTTITSAGACSGSLIAGQTAGAAFVSNNANCNATANSTSPCCYANFNKVNGITVQDIFDFLNDWFAGSRYANFGSNGNPATLAVQNIFDFLNAWFAGGCS